MSKSEKREFLAELRKTRERQGRHRKTAERAEQHGFDSSHSRRLEARAHEDEQAMQRWYAGER